jgi:hypothetical protein
MSCVAPPPSAGEGLGFPMFRFPDVPLSFPDQCYQLQSAVSFAFPDLGCSPRLRDSAVGFAFPIPAMTRDVGDHGDSI